MTSLRGLLTSVVIIAVIFFCSIAKQSEASKGFPDFSCYPLLDKKWLKDRNDDCVKRSSLIWTETVESCLLFRLETYTEMTYGDRKVYTWLPEYNAAGRKSSLIDLIANKGAKGATPDKLKKGEKAVDTILKNLEGCRKIMEEEMRNKPKKEWAPILNCANKAFGCTK